LQSKIGFSLLWLAALAGLGLLAFGAPSQDGWAVGLLSVGLAGLLLERVWPNFAHPQTLQISKKSVSGFDEAHANGSAHASGIDPSNSHTHSRSPRSAQLGLESKLSFHSLAQACHDLRQPTMASSLSISAARALTQEPETALHLDAALRASDELNRMIQSMLDLTELSEQAAPPAMSVVSLAPLLQSVRAQFALRPVGISKEEAEQEEVSIRVRCREDHVLAHAPWITRVLLNLVGNALQHAKAQRILITARQMHGRVHISVWDDGVGMSPQQLAQLSDAAQRRSASKPSKVGQASGNYGLGNYGLGSSIAQRYARAMGSELRVWSQPGRGTRFDLALPACMPGDMLSTDPLEASAAQKFNLHVLLLSQDADLSRQLLPSLQSVCACVSVRSMQEFLQQGLGLSLEAQPVSLVILDEASMVLSQPQSMPSSHPLSDMTYLMRQELASEVDAIWIMRSAQNSSPAPQPSGIVCLERPLVLSRLLEAVSQHAASRGLAAS
jgi:signal transduction histidine kinase